MLPVYKLTVKYENMDDQDVMIHGPKKEQAPLSIKI